MQTADADIFFLGRKRFISFGPITVRSGVNVAESETASFPFTDVFGAVKGRHTAEIKTEADI